MGVKFLTDDWAKALTEGCNANAKFTKASKGITATFQINVNDTAYPGSTAGCAGGTLTTEGVWDDTDIVHAVSVHDIVITKVTDNGTDDLVVVGYEALSRFKAARSAIDLAPIHRPLGGKTRTSSGFGNRTDPFTRGKAFHAGLDFPVGYGTPSVLILMTYSPSSGKVCVARRPPRVPGDSPSCCSLCEASPRTRYVSDPGTIRPLPMASSLIRAAADRYRSSSTGDTPSTSNGLTRRARCDPKYAPALSPARSRARSGTGRPRSRDRRR